MQNTSFKTLNGDVMSLSGSVFHEFVAFGTNELWKAFCEQRVGREEVVYLSVGRNWVSMRQCLEESSTDHVQSYIMCTYWIVAFWTPGRGHWTHSADSGNQYPTFW